jgi:hypothetical protein
MPLGQSMPPTYVFWPERPCDRLDLAVRFHTDRLSQLVWRVSDVFHRDADELQPGPDRLTVDYVGEVATSLSGRGRAGVTASGGNRDPWPCGFR